MILSGKIAEFAKAFRRCVGLALLALPGFALAWSEAGHIAIGEIAVRQLEASQREQLNAIAEYLLDSNGDTASRVKPAVNVSAVARAAVWFDRVRGLTVEQLFAPANVPQSLAAYSEATTDDWHYSNILYPEPSGGGCPPPGGKLVDVLPRLEEAFIAADHAKAQAVSLAMLVHLVGDAHQPLHTITRVTRGCEHDRGGNSFCVTASKGRGCDLNLHQLWDRGLGLFEEQGVEPVITGTVDVLRKGTHESGQVLAPDAWQQENLALARQIYRFEEGRTPGSGYIAWGRGVSHHKVQLAAGRLATILEQLVLQKGLGEAR